MIKRLLILFSIFLFTAPARGQLSDSRYLNNYIKVWGFYKYYHPAIGGGTVDADSLFLEYVEKAVAVSDRQAYQKLLLDMQKALGPVSSNPGKEDRSMLFTINDRTMRIIDDPLVPAPMRKEMKRMRSQGFPGSAHRYMPENFHATELPAEKDWKIIAFPSPALQLLALARYWNAIEYLFPYKYMITKDWNQVLKQQVTEFAKPMTEVDFERHLLQLNAAIEDTHGGALSIKHSREIYGSFFPPFTFRFAGDSMVVTNYIDSFSCVQQDIHKGDVIIGINNNTLREALTRSSYLVSASNYLKKTSLLSAIPLLMPLRSNDSIARLRILRNKQVMSRQLALQTLKNKTLVENINRLYQEQEGYPGGTKNNFVLRSISKDIAQVDAAALSVLFNSSEDDRAIDSVLRLMRQHKKAILVDLRCYATQAVIYNKLLPALGWELKPFLTLKAHSVRFPGNYYEKDIVSEIPRLPLMPPFSGKVILLVNEETRSQSEMITMILQACGPVKVVGTQTAGCDGDLIRLPVPGGYTLSFSGRHVAYIDGTASQKSGVKRDVRVNYTTAGIISSKDEILEAALRLLQ